MSEHMAIHSSHAPLHKQTCTYVKTVVTTTTLSDNYDEKIAQVIAQLKRTRLNFSKLSQLQRKRVRNMQKLIRKKNNTIAALEAKLDTHRKPTRHFAVVMCKNIVYTMSGSKQFVRQRMKNLNDGQQVFFAQRVNCENDRRRIAEALTTALGSGVVARASNKRFEIVDTEKLVSAKLIIQQVLHENGSHGNARAH